MIKCRLLLLAERLDKIAARPPKTRTFEMGLWLRRVKGCNTAACAVGEATLMPAFRKLGLTVNRDNVTRCMQPVYRGRTSWPAVRRFFGIDADTSHSLFTSSAYAFGEVTPRMVAARIRRYVKTGKIA